jgi:LAO/AO transport system kinase
VDDGQRGSLQTVHRPSSTVLTMRRHKSTLEYIEGIRRGDRVVLGQAITLVESTRPEHQEQAQAVLAALLSTNAPLPDAFRIGITGVPGVGKSTLIEALGMYLVEQGKRVAVLAVDPSSAISKGSILGDKTRMERLSMHPNAFIRPTPTGESLGGVGRKTRETILLVEAAGYDTVLIETVGVGQSEIAVHRMTDAFLLLLLPGAGDDLQGIKRGIVEMADVLAVNKADGERLNLANQARMHYFNAVHLLPARTGGWSPPVLACSAETGDGIEALWQTLEKYRIYLLEHQRWDEHRREQARYWLQESLDEGLKAAFYGNPGVQAQLEALMPAVLSGRLSPFAAAKMVLQVSPITSIKSD